jgi:hypothetical protein
VERRSFLQVLSLGGLLPFIKHEEVEAAPPLVVQPQAEPKPYTMGSAFVGGTPVFPRYASGTIAYGLPPHEQAEYEYAIRKILYGNVPSLGGDE